jgi:hypothetical protein
VTGAGADTTIIAARTHERVFEISASATVSIVGVTIRDGYMEISGDGGVILNSGSPEIAKTGGTWGAEARTSAYSLSVSSSPEPGG